MGIYWTYFVNFRTPAFGQNLTLEFQNNGAGYQPARNSLTTKSESSSSFRVKTARAPTPWTGGTTLASRTSPWLPSWLSSTSLFRPLVVLVKEFSALPVRSCQRSALQWKMKLRLPLFACTITFLNTSCSQILGPFWYSPLLPIFSKTF